MSRSFFQKSLLTLFLLLFAKGFLLLAQNNIPSTKVLTTDELFEYLETSNPEIAKIADGYKAGNIEAAKKNLADYFKQRSAERYFFSWKNFGDQFEKYNRDYKGSKENHLSKANELLTDFPSNPFWQIPSKNLKGKEVTAYELRHLARQHKAVDAAFAYYYKNEDTTYLNYFVGQMKSLNKAFAEGKYDDEGNGIYEYFRCGYRTSNWLFAHHLYLASQKYSTGDQLLFIQTILHHGAQLFERTKKYSPGNHHTKGLVGLFLISAMFPEFISAASWQKQAITGLVEHLQKEVNDDGFQFERSIGYHIGDIDNYFYVYRIAQINGIALPDEFTERFSEMFYALTQLAYPDKKLPVLQDDTDEPWAEFNKMDEPLSIGALLFNDPQLKYFTGNKIPSGIFWYLDGTTFKRFKGLQNAAPVFSSTALKTTGYFITRNGWDVSSEYMVITNGLSDKKPDHQHGDILGISAYANGRVILPNYQVRYFLDDFSFFKNSFVKNVALVDSIPQGLKWKKNEGESGFGKWQNLPKPKTNLWLNHLDYDYFSGSHKGYEAIGVNYKRDILFIKKGYWIVRDVFVSNTVHSYQQIWQGNFSEEIKNKFARTTFPDGSGLELILLNGNSDITARDNFRGKSNFVFSKKTNTGCTYVTLVYPRRDFDERLQNISLEKTDINGDTFLTGVKNYLIVKDLVITASDLLKSDGNLYFWDVKEILTGGENYNFKDETNFIIKMKDGGIEMTSLSAENIVLPDVDYFKQEILKPGETITLQMQEK